MRRPLKLFFSPQTRLEAELQTIARSHQSIRIHQRGILIWGTVAAVAAGLYTLRLFYDPIASWLGPLLGLTLVLGAIWQIRGILRDKTDIHEAARRIEQEHPELDTILRTAAEQKADARGKLNFMQQRLLDEAIAKATASLWHQTPRRQSRWLAASHLTTILAAFAFLVFGLRASAPFSFNWSDISGAAATTASGIEITPGSVEIEKGTTVVIAARFNDDFPGTARLVWRQSNGASGRSNMARSLSDPVYAFTLPEVAADTVYQIEYDDDRTADFTLTVFELPDLVRADANLSYPAYTGLTDREFIDTRRISAVAGADLDYEFLVNRPLASARLVTADGEAIELTARNDEATSFGIAYTLIESQRFKLELTDREGRTDPDPADIRIAVQANERPELAMQFPRSDQRVSPLEELNIQAKITDDFGLEDFGIAYAIGAEDPVYVSLSAESASRLESNFEYLLALETHAVEVDELITWFGWAEDFGPDGEVRRTTSDLFFAEVRALDEIFREGQGGGGQSSGGGETGPAGELLEIQRQISIAIWNLQKTGSPSATFDPDVSTLEISQAQAREQVEAVKAQLEEARQTRAADDAGRAMDDTIEHLADARDEISLDPLQSAWTSAQQAFRALLKLQPREVNVTQSNSGSSSGGRSQSQLNQLRFRQEDDNYASQSEAEAPATPEEREQLNVLARLKELARRQDDLNARLQELQTALAAAADEAEREEIRRELKRLEEEQRRMLADLDDTRSRVDEMQAGEQRAEATEQLEQTREDMQRAGEELAQGNVSQALASGTRAQESLEQTGEDLREDSSSLFSDEMRELRRQARELAEQQDELEQQWDEMGNGPPSLDGSSESEALADSVEAQRENYERLIDRIKQASSDSEDAEPVLHRRLYDVLRQQSTGGTDQQLRTANELLRRGFTDQARREQSGVSRSLDQLRDGIERAANSVLGDEGAESRFAQNELSDLARQLRDEMSNSGDQPGEQSGEDGPGREPGDDETRSGLAANGEAGQGQAPGSEPDENGVPGPQPGEGNTPGFGPSGEPSENGEQLASTPGQGQPGNAPGEGQEPGEGQTPGTTPGEGEGTVRVATASGQPGQGQGQGEGQPGENPGTTLGQGQGQGQGQAQGQGEGQPGEASGQSPGQGQGSEGPPSSNDLLEQLAQALGTQPGGAGSGGNQGGNGPLTGESFAEWADRLRTIESLMDDPELRQRLAQARGRAEEMRRDWQREAAEPQWDLVDTGIIQPLEDARAWLRQELARLEDPEILQPIDRDPVPEKYAESVRKYYEALSAAESEQPPNP